MTNLFFTKPILFQNIELDVRTATCHTRVCNAKWHFRLATSAIVTYAYVIIDFCTIRVHLHYRSVIAMLILSPFSVTVNRQKTPMTIYFWHLTIWYKSDRIEGFRDVKSGLQKFRINTKPWTTKEISSKWSVFWRVSKILCWLSCFHYARKKVLCGTFCSLRCDVTICWDLSITFFCIVIFLVNVMTSIFVYYCFAAIIHPGLQSCFHWLLRIRCHYFNIHVSIVPFIKLDRSTHWVVWQSIWTDVCLDGITLCAVFTRASLKTVFANSQYFRRLSPAPETNIFSLGLQGAKYLESSYELRINYEMDSSSQFILYDTKFAFERVSASFSWSFVQKIIFSFKSLQPFGWKSNIWIKRKFKFFTGRCRKSYIPRNLGVSK